MKGYKVESEFEYKGIKCVVMGLSAGHRCGYVKIDKPTEDMINDPFSLDLNVHGGITYGNYSMSYPVISSERTFWLGFDCSHYNDGKDMELIKELASKQEYEHILKMETMFPIEDEIVRTAEYVEGELKLLVDQLVSEHTTH